MKNISNTTGTLSKTNIVFVINDYFGHGGHVKSFLSQFSELRQHLHSFHVICADGGYFFHNRKKFGLAENEVTAVDMRNLKHFYFSYCLYCTIKKKLADNAILHVYYGDCYFSCLLAKTHFKNVSLFCSIMGGPSPFPRLPSADCYIAVSPEQLIQVGATNTTLIERGKTAIVKNRLSVDPHLTKVMQQSELKRGILIVTRFDPDKTESLELLAKIALAIPENISIRFAGTGQLLDQFKIRFSGKKNIEFLGFCQDFSEYYKNTSVVLGMGRSILEFMLNGMPAVLVGFVGTQLLDDLDSVAFASERNFAGRTILREPSFSDLILYIIRRTNSFTPLNSQVREFLYREYSVEQFTQRYADILDKSQPLETGRLQFILEYFYIFFRRIIRCVKRKLTRLNS